MSYQNSQNTQNIGEEKEVKTYVITPTQQLFDLNGDLTNFELEVKIMSEGSKPFDVMVADQTTLDSGKIQYTSADQGVISINLKNDNNVYQNYFLVLRAKEPCRCSVEITKKQIPANLPKKTVKIEEKGINWIRVIAILLIVIVVCYIVYKFVFSGKKAKNTEAEENGRENREEIQELGEVRDENPRKSLSIQSAESEYQTNGKNQDDKWANSPSHSPSVHSSPSPSPSKSPNKEYTNSLLGRLKRLNV